MKGLDNRKLVWILAGLLGVMVVAFAWSLTRGYEQKKEEVRAEAVPGGKEPAEEACASAATYARLKEVAFEEAVRLRNADPANLDTLAAHSVVRMEDPVVLNRDEELNVTVCSGRFILELPPGAEAAFGGQRRLTASIEYAAQEAADGSGLVYEIRGAEPIVRQLAGFGLQGPRFQPPAAPAETELAQATPPPQPPVQPAPAAQPAPAPAPTPAPAPAPPPRPQAKAPPPQPRPAAKPAPRPQATPERTATSARPSFNCRYARARSERMVCSSDRLAAKDRAMSSLFYSALAGADPRTRAELRRTRDRFLAYRERCSSEACVAEAYDGRVREIRDIVADAR